VLVFDGDCGFCRYCVDYARAVTDDAAPGRVRYEPFQTAAQDHPDVAIAEFERSIQLFTGTERCDGAKAAFTVLALAPRLRGWLWCYRFVPLFAAIAEAFYRLTARHRGAVYRLARPFFGKHLAPLRYERTSALIVRGIGFAALCAFGSWWWQADGLVGANGILPVSAYFDAAKAQLGPHGWLLVPSLYWLSSADGMTTALCAVGVLASLCLLLRIWTAPAALVAYVCYLSLQYGGQEFLSFQWDTLLIESLLLAAVLGIQPRVGVWLTRLLVFRFMLLSGAVKLASDDPTWRDLAALDVHFETQPLPTVLAWYAHQLPHGLLHAAVGATFAIELVLPFLIFLPRNLRLLAAAGFIGLEVLIALTGNYNFFNLLTIVLCLALLDDRALRLDASRPERHSSGMFWRGLIAMMALLGVLQIHATLARSGLSNWEAAVLRTVEPLEAVNNYGLFAVMTTRRDELIVEGSDDGENWQVINFRYKPQELNTAPRWVAPYQPRLDWQMWFAALTTRAGAPWFDFFVLRLLTGEPAVMRLLAPSPFAEHPPRVVRVLRYQYHFTTAEEKHSSGAWWRRDFVGVWYPPARLDRP
jgi:predicted DCC family thiol-disulfide oxidoreductase YuxK